MATQLTGRARNCNITRRAVAAPGALGACITRSTRQHKLRALPRVQSVVVEPLSHNPQAVIAPDGTVVIYTLFDGWPQNGVPQNCSSGGGEAISAEMAASGWPFRGPGLRPSPRRPLDTGNCTVVAQPDNCEPGPCWRCNITLHASTSFDAPGPWESVPAAIIGLSNVDNMFVWGGGG